MCSLRGVWYYMIRGQALSMPLPHSLVQALQLTGVQLSIKQRSYHTGLLYTRLDVLEPRHKIV